MPDVVGGPITTLGEGATGEAIAVAVSSPFGVGNAVFRYSQREQWTDTVAFPAYRRDVFDRIGPFEEIEGGEDDEFHYRLRDAGGQILLTPSIRSTYYARRSFWELARQYFGYGQAKVVVLSRHPRRTRLRQLVPSIFVIALLATVLLALFGGWFVTGVAVLAGAYAMVSLGVSLAVARVRGWRHLWRLPLERQRPGDGRTGRRRCRTPAPGRLRRQLHDHVRDVVPRRLLPRADCASRCLRLRYCVGR
jgi:GT2 family glycosyltransferase